MPKAKSPRTTKTKAEKNVLQMPEAASNGRSTAAADLESEIRDRAYQLYAERGYTNGRAEEDWAQAEREVLSRHGKNAQSA